MDFQTFESEVKQQAMAINKNFPQRITDNWDSNEWQNILHSQYKKYIKNQTDTAVIESMIGATLYMFCMLY